MKAVKCLVLLMALACCVESRQRLGKIFKRQARQREYKAIQTSQAGFIPQSVVRNSWQNLQGQQAQYQQAPQQPAQPSFQEFNLGQALKPDQYQPVVQSVYKTVPLSAQSIAVRDYTNKVLMRLPRNATLISPIIDDGFSCVGKAYGYYADVANDCQIYHVCFPLRAVFNNDPAIPDKTYQYSFICNEFTRFAQDSMTCTWAYELESCVQSEMMYSMNDFFFKTTTSAPVPIGGYVSGPGPVPIGGYNSAEPLHNSNLLTGQQPYQPPRN